MATTIVHAADLHLERAFPDARSGARRRAAIRDALVRIVDIALARRADALTLGGDIVEAERATPQTARFLFGQLARFAGPVLIAPGNHDPFAARSLWARDDLPSNVRVFAEPVWSAFPLADDVTIYGFGHTPAEPGRPFAHARFDRPGARIALVHGSDEERCPPGKRATAPFTAAEIIRAGATFALTGHYHGGYTVTTDGVPTFAYPGSPEPIGFGERGEHGALVVSIGNDGVRIQPVPLARTRLIDLDVRVDGATSDHDVEARLATALAGYGADDVARVRLQGTIERGTRIDPAALAERCGGSLSSLTIDDRTIAADYDAIARQPNVRGHAVAELLLRAREGDAEADAALRYVVAAFEGIPIAP